MRRDAARKQIAEGIDPSALRQETKQATQRDALNIVEAVSRAALAHRASGWTEGTLEATPVRSRRWSLPSGSETAGN
jgi:hypothetical protein